MVPASGNGLTATVNSDGSLHVTGTPTRQWSGLSWTFHIPVQETMILRTSVFISGLSFSVKFLDAKGEPLGASSSRQALPWQRLTAPSACASTS